MSQTAPASIDPDEIARFSALADSWWDPDGPFRPLHRFNPTRLSFLRDRIGRHFESSSAGDRPFSGLRLLDIGCGGGLIAEPMARLGATVTGVDASARNIGVAALHAEAAGLAIDYRCTSAEDLAASGERFDVVLALEVVEHVADIGTFFTAVGQMAAPGGIVVAATLNRTAKAFALAIVGAEYVLRWLPRGTHQWRKFVRPSELDAAFRAADLKTAELTGVAYNPLTDNWTLSTDVAVNYMMVATK